MGKFNQVLLNCTLMGSHYIGAHSDDEKQLISGSPIISITRGATRKFRIRKKDVKDIYKDILIHDRMVLIMGVKFQEEFTHTK